jgi:MFS family permease
LSLSANIVALGLVSFLMGTSSAMIHGLLPVFLVTVLGASIVTVGVIEGTAEGMVSLAKILSGVASDRLGRRKPLVMLGYALSAVVKLLFPLAWAASTVLLARVLDRVGKGVRDAPRDALVADVTPSPVRGTGFGLRLALYSMGAVLGPLLAVGLMSVSGNDFRLIFWLAAIPAFLSVVVLKVCVTDSAAPRDRRARNLHVRASDLMHLGPVFWWVVALATTFSLARFSQAFLLLKAHDVGIDAAFIPIVLVLMNLVFSVSAYPFGMLADRLNRRLQLLLGSVILIAADLVLAFEATAWAVALGAALWGFQMGVTQGLLSASVADAAPVHIRGTAFGIYDVVVGVATFCASFGAGMLWAAAGPGAPFVVGACVASGAALILLFRPSPWGNAPSRTES